MASNSSPLQVGFGSSPRVRLLIAFGHFCRKPSHLLRAHLRRLSLYSTFLSPLFDLIFAFKGDVNFLRKNILGIANIV